MFIGKYMKIIVKVKTRAKEESVERVGQPMLGFENPKEKRREEMVTYKVSVKEAPVGGKANEAIIKALAKYFNISKFSVHLISGQTSKQKIFEIFGKI